MRHIAALGVVFLFAWVVAASGAEPDFLKASLRFDHDALVRGEAFRLAVLYFGADWCFPCKVWHYGNFRNAGIIETSGAFKRIKVDLTHLEEGPMKDFSRRFNSVNPPGVFIIRGDGEVAASYRDPPTAKEFLKAMRDAAGDGREAGG